MRKSDDYGCLWVWTGKTIMGAIGSGLDVGWISHSGIQLSSKPSEPDRTVFDLQHICMKLHRRNGLRRQPAAVPVHLLISSVLTPCCEPFPQLKYLHITMDSFEQADQTRCFLFSCGALSECFNEEIPSKDGLGLVGEAASHPSIAPPISLFHAFPSSLTRFYL